MAREVDDDRATLEWHVVHGSPTTAPAHAHAHDSGSGALEPQAAPALLLSGRSSVTLDLLRATSDRSPLARRSMGVALHPQPQAASAPAPVGRVVASGVASDLAPLDNSTAKQEASHTDPGSLGSLCVVPVGNRRKRSREAMAMAMAPPPPAVKEEYINLFALQAQQQQQSAPYFNMAQQLHGNRVASSASPAPVTRVSTGLRLALDEQQQRQINSLCYASSLPSPFGSFSDEFAGQVKQHGEELDKFIRDQGEQLRRAIADRVRQHNRALLVAAEKSASRRLREKTLEAEREARRGAELEERLARLRAEAAAWQAKALSEQATAVALHAQLQQTAAAAARASCDELADGGDAGPAESSSSAYVDPCRAGPDRACHACRRGPATVVLLPCRHLSLCGGCLAAGDMDVSLACPLCHCVRTGSVEAILS